MRRSKRHAPAFSVLAEIRALSSYLRTVHGMSYAPGEAEHMGIVLQFLCCNFCTSQVWEVLDYLIDQITMFLRELAKRSRSMLSARGSIAPYTSRGFATGEVKVR